ncbi:MAG TPA: response regulator [Flavobacterium sp.]|jgi:DNA-binding response OmpR family regulator
MQKVIFFTDDDQDDLHLMKEISDLLGQNAILFHDGNEMLAKLQTEKPQIIFLDVEMPMKHGFDILREIRAVRELDDIPIVMLSSKCDEKCVATCFELGANYFIPKAYSFSGLKKSIEHAMNVSWEEFTATEADFLYQL